MLLTPPDSLAAQAERRFFAGLGLASCLLVVVAFASSYYLRPFGLATRLRPLPPVVHLHAVLFTGWILLLVTQILLVVGHRVATHRRLGWLAAGLLPLMLATGLAAAIAGGRDGWHPGGPYLDALGFMFVGVADLIVFGTLTVAGLVWRHRPGVHRRVMMLATVGGLMWPAITRLPGIAGRVPAMFGLLVTLVLVTALRDLRVRSPYRWLSLGVGLAILATFPLRVAIANGSGWRAIAEWLVR